MAWIHSQFGLNGVVFLFSFLIAFVSYLQYKILRSNDGNIIISTLIVLFAAMVSSLHWLARPHIFSFLFMLIWYFLLDEYQYRDRDHLFLFPLIMLFWVNLHGGFITGYVLAGIFLLGNLIEAFFSDGVKKRELRKKVLHYLSIIILSLGAALINPRGYKILLFPASVISNKFLMDHVVEFLSPNFHSLEVILFEILFLFSLTIFLVSIKRLNPIEILLFIFFAHMSFYSIRYIALFSLIIPPILIRQISFMMQEGNSKLFLKFKYKSQKYIDIDQQSRGFLWPCLALLLVVFAIGSEMVNYHFDPKIKPIKAVEFIKKEPIKGNMFNNDEFGDIIIYDAFPQYKVFIDGRSDMYDIEKFKEYNKVVSFKPGWESIIEKYKIKWIFFDSDSPLSRYLLERNDWKLIYSDKVANIFVKNVAEYEYLIKRYKNIKPATKEEKEQGK